MLKVLLCCLYIAPVGFHKTSLDSSCKPCPWVLSETWLLVIIQKSNFICLHKNIFLAKILCSLQKPSAQNRKYILYTMSLSTSSSDYKNINFTWKYISTLFIFTFHIVSINIHSFLITTVFSELSGARWIISPYTYIHMQFSPEDHRKFNTHNPAIDDPFEVV